MDIDLVYPIFLKISYYAHNMFWKHLFENMAYNRPPICIYIRHNNDILSVLYKHKKRGFIYHVDMNIDVDNIKGVYNELYKLLFNNAKLYSQQEKSNVAVDCSLCWNNVKKTFIKTNMLLKYIITKTNITDINEARKLFYRINLGISFKSINSSNIVFANKEISALIL